MVGWDPMVRYVGAHWLEYDRFRVEGGQGGQQHIKVFCAVSWERLDVDESWKSRQDWRDVEAVPFFFFLSGPLWAVFIFHTN